MNVEISGRYTIAYSYRVAKYQRTTICAFVEVCILLRKPDGKEADMEEKQAQELAQDIRREAPHLLVKVDTVEEIGWKAWAVYIYARGSNRWHLESCVTRKRKQADRDGRAGRAVLCFVSGSASTPVEVAYEEET